MKNNLKKYFVFIFLLLLILPGCYWLFINNNEPEFSLLENRNMVIFPSYSIKYLKTAISHALTNESQKVLNTLYYHYQDRGFASQVEKASNHQFPYRIELIQLSKSIDRVFIEGSYLFLENEIVPASRDSDLFIDKHDQLLIPPPNKANSSQIDHRISNYEELSETYTEINFNIFYIDKIASSQYHPLIESYPESNRGQEYLYFQSQLPENINLSSLLLNSYDDHKKYFFRTDHHWNIRGAIYGYDQIYEMLSENYTNISPKIEIDSFINLSGVNFLGSLARESMYPLDSEPFEVALYSIPPYRIFNEAGESINSSQKEEYLQGKFQTENYVNHYRYYYGTMLPYKEYQFDNNATRNLLVFASSYITPIQPMIASHYHSTYYIDLRKYEDFSLSTFLEQHPVDDILILGTDVEIYSDSTWQISP